MSVFRQLQELFFTDQLEPESSLRLTDKRPWWQFWSSDDDKDS